MKEMTYTKCYFCDEMLADRMPVSWAPIGTLYCNKHKDAKVQLVRAYNPTTKTFDGALQDATVSYPWPENTNWNTCKSHIELSWLITYKSFNIQIFTMASDGFVDAKMIFQLDHLPDIKPENAMETVKRYMKLMAFS